MAGDDRKNGWTEERHLALDVAPMMKCEKAVALVLEFLEGTLNPETHRALQGHLAKCRPCQRLVTTYEKTTQLCRAALFRQPPAGFGDRLRNFLRQHTLHNKDNCE